MKKNMEANIVAQTKRIRLMCMIFLHFKKKYQ